MTSSLQYSKLSTSVANTDWDITLKDVSKVQVNTTVLAVQLKDLGGVAVSEETVIWNIQMSISFF
ncbi:hypothetical protein EST38_g13704 [Candolleomyces aberdarensis]|uniref:Uncharacterized protein n=1 Tax=Candolleomyces aberdarensis TaxID=2316362 RepID=A0A4Q2D035_9AGAR|nr:hypothetical protein EST38_g13704 [Candolleomyces aberdarensis]